MHYLRMNTISNIRIVHRCAVYTYTCIQSAYTYIAGDVSRNYYKSFWERTQRHTYRRYMVTRRLRDIDSAGTNKFQDYISKMGRCNNLYPTKKEICAQVSLLRQRRVLAYLHSVVSQTKVRGYKQPPQPPPPPPQHQN